MKKLYMYFCLVICALVSCSKNETTEIAEIQISQDSEPYILGPEINDKLTIKFTSTESWQAKINVNWAVLTSSKGEAGISEIAILAKEENKSGESRQATLTISSATISKDIIIEQQQKDIINLANSQFNLTSDKQELIITYTSNLEGCAFNLTNTSSTDINWISIKQDETKSLKEGLLVLNIESNDEKKERKASLIIEGVDLADGSIRAHSQLLTITQSAAPIGLSTDYSQDKKAYQLQQHSQGNGIPLIFMGDGFLDKDIASNYYRRTMEKGVENFFTEEPVKSLRDYFDIWYINAVSANNAFGDSYSTTFSCWLEGNGSTLIEGNHDKVMEYAMQVPILKENPEFINEATCIVILNTEDYAGTCYFGFNDGVNTLNLAIGYCPMIYGMEDDMFRRVLCHECIGHGFAKLLDEYSYQEQGRIPDSEIANNRIMQQMGWAANVDFTNNRDEVLWNKFLKDSRYQGADHYEEVLGVYEGACTYWSGAYRPTNESMMRSNTHGFNAPSREAIYKRIMRTAYGSIWEYDYETFVEFDQAHLPTPTETRTCATREEANRPFTPPVFTNKTISIK